MSEPTLSFSVLIGILTSVLVLCALAGGGPWWRLFFLPVVWSGHPRLGPFGNAMIAAADATSVEIPVPDA